MVKRRFAEMLPAKKLTALPPGQHADGRGLYLMVSPTGSRRWMLRVVVKGGRRREFGLGSLHETSLQDARRAAAEMRRGARDGRDPLAERRSRNGCQVTFRQAYDRYFAVKCKTLGNAKHLAQWPSTMEAYVFPIMGDRPVCDVTSGEVLAVLEPIWHSKPETAKRVLQRMQVVFDAAILHNWREKASPCIGVTQALGGTRHRAVTHHRALPYQRLPEFLHMLRNGRAHAVSKLAFEFLVLTASRSGEARGAMWSEIDLLERVWVIPKERMKGMGHKRREHVVPLSSRCVEILSEVEQYKTTSTLVFPSPRTNKKLSDMIFTKLLRDLGLDDVATAHGFRSAFRDWATEVDRVREVVAEAALAHSVRDKTEGAYRRAAYLGERRGLMERWAQYTAESAPDVLQSTSACLTTSHLPEHSAEGSV